MLDVPDPSQANLPMTDSLYDPAPAQHDRLAASPSPGLIDTTPEESCARVVALASRALGMPIALISLVDDGGQSFKAQYGPAIPQAAIQHAFCRFAMQGRDVMVVPDAMSDPRFAQNALVTDAPYVRFYAGMPLVIDDGACLGTLSVIDQTPHPGLDGDQVQTLRDLAAIVVDTLKHRMHQRHHLASRRQVAIAETLTSLAADAPGFDIAIRDACAVLREACAAQSCLVMRMTDTAPQLRFVCGVDADNGDSAAYAALRRAIGVDAAVSMAARVMGDGEQRLCRVAELDPQGAEAIAAAGHGQIETLLFTPFRLNALRYVLIVAFGSGADASAEGAALMRHAAVGIRPLLRRLQDEERLQYFERVLEAAADAILITEAEPIDQPGPRIIYANAACESVTGYSLAEMLGRTPRMFQGADTDREALDRIRVALQQWKPVRETVLNHTKDGVPYWVELNIAPVANSEGWYTHWISVQRDQTVERGLRAEVEASHRDLADLIQAMPGVMMRHRKRADGKWIRTYIAPSIFDLAGYTVEEAMVYGWWVSNVNPADLPEMYEALNNALAGAHCTITFRFIRKDRKWIWIRLILRGHVDRHGDREVIGIWSDVTREREMAAQLAHTSKLAQLGEMATSMAHELNQPLATISLAAQNAERDIASADIPRERLNRRLRKIVSMTERAAEIIDHMRVFGRMQDGPGNAVELRKVIANAMMLMQGKLRDSMVRVTADLPADLPPVLGRGIALEQVIMNLIGNACDAYRDNPASEPDQPRLIGMRARQDGNLIHLSVWDRAGGIQSGALEYIFQPFFTTKPIGQGTGLGLSVSYGIITDHGGTIEAHNQDGGAWFEIRLPVAIAA